VDAPPGTAHDIPGAFYLPSSSMGSELEEILSVQAMVRSYQVSGHRVANLDPLGIRQADLSDDVPVGLSYEDYGWTDKDLEKEFEMTSSVSTGYLGKGSFKLGGLVKSLNHTYCSSIGFEFMHLQSRTVVNWFRDRVEHHPMFAYSPAQKKLVLERLMDAEIFEQFLQTKFANDKRFGLDGCEALIPGMKALIDSSVDMGVMNVVIGMPHRGRLNVLTQVMQKPMEAIFCEFAGRNDGDDEGSGDVKYHLGTSVDRKTRSGKMVHLSLAANPSHLEAVNPVVAGKTKAMQQSDSGSDPLKSTMSVLLHGDAAFAGQGVVYETFGFSELPDYATGGTVHIIVNNQIGFTTDPRFSRSTPYCCDLGKSYNAPIFHVNGDDPEAVVFTCNLAAEWRQTYHKDVIVDIICYRRHGHNEQDQPMFTQPLMYGHIAKHPTPVQIYSQKLIKENIVTQEYVDMETERIQGQFEDAFQRSVNYKPDTDTWMESRWTKFKNVYRRNEATGVSIDTLTNVGNSSCVYPMGFVVHRSLDRILKARAKTVDSGKGIDFGTAEAMAFGSLLLQGVHVRLSGQDVQRGTFSHRHAMLHHQDSEERYVPLQHLSDTQAKFTVSNSHLSEYGVLGFELGYSMQSPKQLVIWEAQFGDFANTAQCIIDQFISSGETKWHRQSGLVMLLPHGYEGMGPEHSSARLERFLQMTEEDPDIFPEDTNDEDVASCEKINWCVINSSTAANYFHALRRQVIRGFRKPLVSLQPKSLLRLKEACSPVEDMVEGTRFLRLIPESSPESLKPASAMRRIVFCTGKVYYDLVRARELNSVDDVAIVRVEQLAPFPFDRVKHTADLYPNAQVLWCQEEPQNQGSWHHVDPRIETALRETVHHAGSRPKYAGRPPTASTATGHKYGHVAELHRFLQEALLSHDWAGAATESVVGGFPIWSR